MCHSGLLPGAALIGCGAGILLSLLIQNAFVLILLMLALIGVGAYLLQK